jgi:(p)ppGpp synthase/HD superfamily hydrolase
MTVQKGTLESAIIQATNFHAGQESIDGLPYILHPLTVLAYITEMGYGDREQIVAVLHDVCEDCDVPPEEFGDEFDFWIVDALDAITRRKEEPYEGYIDRVGANLIATRVKLADLTHNMTLSRLPVIGAKESNRHAKYARAEAILTARLYEMEG